jgi:hypothetical protein
LGLSQAEPEGAAVLLAKWQAEGCSSSFGADLVKAKARSYFAGAVFAFLMFITIDFCWEEFQFGWLSDLPLRTLL